MDIVGWTSKRFSMLKEMQKEEKKKKEKKRDRIIMPGLRNILKQQWGIRYHRVSIS